MHDQIERVRRSHVKLMRLTGEILGHVLKNVTQEQAQTLRDGAEGWTILEVLGHLRDFDGFFRHRAQMMLDNDHPDLPAYDHEALAIDRNYNADDLAYAYDQFNASRQQTIDFFKDLTEEQWQRTGNHPERDQFTMLDAVIQVGLHDADHLEQITRILEQEVPGSGAIPSGKYETF